MNSKILTRKFLGSAGIVLALFATSFVGVSSASAYFSLSGKNLQFHAIIQSMTPSSMTLITSSTDPITVTTNLNTKYPFGMPKTGDVVFVIARVKNDGSIVALIVKKSKSGGPSDIYGTDGDDVTVKKVTVKQSSCPWLRVNSPMGGNTTLVFKVTPSTHFIGTVNCQSLSAGDVVSITGVDNNQNGFDAKTVIKHNKKQGDNLPDNEANDN